MDHKKVLIVSNRLGLSEGVGGRRWLALGNELENRGFRVFFITFSKPAGGFPASKQVLFLHADYPHILKSKPLTISDKICYRLALLKQRIFTGGSLFDETARSRKIFLNAASTLIENEKIYIVIVSGAPFSLLYYGALLKRKYPQIKYIADFRDGWTRGTGYGMSNLTAKRFEFERMREKMVVATANAVTVASPDLVTKIERADTNVEPLIVPNFVDVTFSKVRERNKKARRDNKIVITHIGSVNVGTEHFWKAFLLHLRRFNEERGILLHFVGNSNGFLEEFVRKNQIDFVRFIPRQDKENLLEYLNESDFFVLFKHPEFPHSFPTKFFDYIQFRKPIICYSRVGDVTREISENRIGLVFDEKTGYNELSERLAAFFYDPSQFNTDYDPSKFDLVRSADLLENLINAIK